MPPLPRGFCLNATLDTRTGTRLNLALRGIAEIDKLGGAVSIYIQNWDSNNYLFAAHPRPRGAFACLIASTREMLMTGHGQFLDDYCDRLGLAFRKIIVANAKTDYEKPKSL